MGMITENKPIGWAILTGACGVVGVGWFLAWFNSPWPLVGYIVSGLVLSIPLIMGIMALVQRCRLKRKQEDPDKEEPKKEGLVIDFTKKT